MLFPFAFAAALSDAVRQSRAERRRESRITSTATIFDEDYKQAGTTNSCTVPRALGTSCKPFCTYPTRVTGILKLTLEPKKQNSISHTCGIRRTGTLERHEASVG